MCSARPVKKAGAGGDVNIMRHGSDSRPRYVNVGSMSMVYGRRHRADRSDVQSCSVIRVNGNEQDFIGAVGTLTITTGSILKIRRHPEIGNLYLTVLGKRFLGRGVETSSESRSKIDTGRRALRPGGGRVCPSHPAKSVRACFTQVSNTRLRGWHPVPRDAADCRGVSPRRRATMIGNQAEYMTTPAPPATTHQSAPAIRT